MAKGSGSTRQKNTTTMKQQKTESMWDILVKREEEKRKKMLKSQNIFKDENEAELSIRRQLRIPENYVLSDPTYSNGEWQVTVGADYVQRSDSFLYYDRYAYRNGKWVRIDRDTATIYNYL